MRPRFLLLAALLLAAAVTMGLASVPSSTGGPDGPQGPELVPLCGVCGPPLQDAAAEHGITVADRPSTLHIQVARNGSARWTIRRSLSNATAANLRANDSRLRSIVYRAIRGGTVTETKYRTMTVNGTTLRVQYRVSSFAHRSAGVLLVDFIHGAGRDEHRYVTWYNDRITVRAPAGMSVVNQPVAASTQPQSVQWPAGKDYTHLGTGTFIVFASDRGSFRGRWGSSLSR